MADDRLHRSGETEPDQSTGLPALTSQQPQGGRRMVSDPRHITNRSIQGRYLMRPDPEGKLNAIVGGPRSLRPEPGRNERAS